ncbi:Glutathione hydrolase 1 proenzyme [Sarcoptes scabiei]|uniref:Gamma-glutamyltransferase 5a-like protein n=1 Tax=Sarcoptes scabiei TaxID=52283 RepID=A0A132ADK8_SARSC|nr:Glutathione hydrolase 1 proenzyme [Sarcoptes scabiei]KPM09071.1 gamma-glutamyltransferase 5a-like protein [Sarcoptes scabiei]
MSETTNLKGNYEPSSSSSSNDPASVASATRYGSFTTFKRTNEIFIDSRYPRTYFTRKQILMAAVSVIFFAIALIITLVFGLPKLESKREEYYTAKHLVSVERENIHNRFSVIISDYDHSDCADSGKRLLDIGGSVVDAALASIFCLTLTSPHIVGFDSMIRAVLNHNDSIYMLESDRVILEINGKRFAYPSMPIVAKELHDRFGLVSWSSIVDPSYRLAVNGFTLNNQIIKSLSNKNLIDFLQNTFNLNQTSLHRESQIFTNTALAKTFELISQNNQSEMNKIFIREVLQTLDLRDIESNKLLKALEATEMIKFRKPFRHSILKDNFEMYSGTINDCDLSVCLIAMIKLIERLNHRAEQCLVVDEKNRSFLDNALELHKLFEVMQFGIQTLANLQSKHLTPEDVLDDSKFIESVASKIEEKFSNLNNDIRKIETLFSTSFSSLPTSNEQNEFVQITVNDVSNRSVIALLISKRNLLRYPNESLVTNRLRMILDVLKNSDRNVWQGRWPSLIRDRNHKQSYMTFTTTGDKDSIMELESLFQVLYRLLIRCQSLKSSVDDSRIFFEPPAQFGYEENYPRAYIDYFVQALRSDWQINHINRSPAVYAMINSGAAKSNSTETHSIIDHRRGGWISGQ